MVRIKKNTFKFLIRFYGVKSKFAENRKKSYVCIRKKTQKTSLFTHLKNEIIITYIIYNNLFLRP